MAAPAWQCCCSSPLLSPSSGREGERWTWAPLPSAPSCVHRPACLLGVCVGESGGRGVEAVRPRRGRPLALIPRVSAPLLQMGSHVGEGERGGPGWSEEERRDDRQIHNPRERAPRGGGSGQREAVSSSPLLLSLSPSPSLWVRVSFPVALLLSLSLSLSLCLSPLVCPLSSLPHPLCPFLLLPSSLSPLLGTRSAAQAVGVGCCVIAVSNAQALCPCSLEWRQGESPHTGSEGESGEEEEGCSRVLCGSESKTGGVKDEGRYTEAGCEGGERGSGEGSDDGYRQAWTQRRERERIWRDTCSSIRLEASGDYPLNLSISLSGGKEINRDLPSSGERTGVSPTLNRGSIHVGREMWGKGLPAPREHAPHFTNQSAGARRPRVPHHRG